MVKWNAMAGGALASLAACSSTSGDGAVGGAGGSGNTGDIPEFPSVVDLNDAHNEALAAFFDDGEGPTPAGQVQSSGSATFAGTIVINGDPTAPIDASVLGGMVVEVTFGNENRISGEAGNFFNVDGSEVTGTLVLSDSEFTSNGAERGYESALDGQLENVGSGDTKATFGFVTTLSETFGGENVSTLSGIGEGSATRIGTSQTQDVTISSIKARQ